MRHASKTPSGRLVGAKCLDQIKLRRNLCTTVAGALRTPHTYVCIYIMYMYIYTNIYNARVTCKCCTSDGHVYLTAMLTYTRAAAAKPLYSMVAGASACHAGDAGSTPEPAGTKCLGTASCCTDNQPRTTGIWKTKQRTQQLTRDQLNRQNQQPQYRTSNTITQRRQHATQTLDTDAQRGPLIAQGFRKKRKGKQTNPKHTNII